MISAGGHTDSATASDGQNVPPGGLTSAHFGGSTAPAAPALPERSWPGGHVPSARVRERSWRADQAPFGDRCIICCGMLHPEVTWLVENGFMSPRQVLFTPPGLHALPDKLEEHLLKRLDQAREVCPDHKIIVVYGKKCYVSADEQLKRVDSILREAGDGIVRVQGDYGYDMLAGFEDRQRISQGRQDKILWFTPGWLKSWKTVYQTYFGWDRADANANFPGYYDKIIVLDALNLGEEYMIDRPEEILELFDWTGLEVEFQPITLDRFKGLLTASLTVQSQRGA